MRFQKKKRKRKGFKTKNIKCSFRNSALKNKHRRMKLLYNPFNYEVERNRGILLAKRADRTPRDEVRRQQVRSINCSFRLKQIADRVRLISPFFLQSSSDLLHGNFNYIPNAHLSRYKKEKRRKKKKSKQT